MPTGHVAVHASIGYRRSVTHKLACEVNTTALTHVIVVGAL
jgi:hypothetical protein